MTKAHRHYHATVWCTLLCLFLSLWNISLAGVDLDGSIILAKRSNVSLDTAATVVTLMPGELPGYTGWARLEYTLAGSFRIISQDAVTMVGNEWNVTVECTECHHGNAQFYARAYGPAVLAGNVHTVNNNRYTVRFLPMDAGTYTVEVVLVSSSVPSWDEFPIVGQEPWYEGFLLPDFPLQLHVTQQKKPLVVKPSCALTDLLSNTMDSAYSKARWVVVDKVSHRNHIVSINASRQANIGGYRSGHQSLGIFMDYRYRGCMLYSFTEAAVRLASYTNKTNAHGVFVGDSVMRLQHELFQSTFPNMKTTFLSTSGGIVQMIHNVTTELQSLAQVYPDQRLLLLFNTGLHDITQLCSRVGRDDRANYITESDSIFSCTAQYHRSFQQFVNFIEQYPADLRVFQSTTAGWPRYGNYDIEWLKNETQSLALTSNMVAHFNEIAYTILLNNKHTSIQIMDAYWLTYARPDNRQAGLKKNTKKRLVHPGEEVLRTMVRNWILILVEHLSRGT